MIDNGFLVLRLGLNDFKNMFAWLVVEEMVDSEGVDVQVLKS